MPRIYVVILGLSLMATCAGCEGWNRRSTPPTDLHEPPRQVLERNRSEGVSMADEVEGMLESRQAYLDRLTRLEKLYLERGDIGRANWARRQRDVTSNVTVYPFGTDDAPEQSPEASPKDDSVDANQLYDEGLRLVQSFRKVPLAGTIPANQEKARKAVELWKQLLRDHPRSDKVDDAAYWVGECYKEYLREDDPDNALAMRYYRWALELDPKTPHPVRFQMAVVYDYRMHDHKRALEMYRRVIDEDENYHPTNPRYAQARITELTDEKFGRDRPREEREPRSVDAESNADPVS